MSKSTRILITVGAAFTATGLLCNWAYHIEWAYWTAADLNWAHSVIRTTWMISMLAMMGSVLALWLSASVDKSLGVRHASIGVSAGAFILIVLLFSIAPSFIVGYDPESHAINTLQMISDLEKGWKERTGDYVTIERLWEGLSSSPGHWNGYVFTVTVTPRSSSRDSAFSCVAEPERKPAYGWCKKRYYLDESGVTRFTKDGSKPSAQSPVLNNAKSGTPVL